MGQQEVAPLSVPKVAPMEMTFDAKGHLNAMSSLPLEEKLFGECARDLLCSSSSKARVSL